MPPEMYLWSPMGQEGWDSMDAATKIEYERRCREALPGAFAPGAFPPKPAKPLEFAMPTQKTALELFSELSDAERKLLNPDAKAAIKKLIDAEKPKPSPAPAIPKSGHVWI